MLSQTLGIWILMASGIAVLLLFMGRHIFLILAWFLTVVVTAIVAPLVAYALDLSAPAAFYALAIVVSILFVWHNLSRRVETLEGALRHPDVVKVADAPGPRRVAS